jgi:hypothetical protein
LTLTVWKTCSQGSRIWLTAQVLFLFAVFPPLSGCVSYSVLKDARALDPGAFQFDVAAGRSVIRPRSGATAFAGRESSGIGEQTMDFPALELQARYGIERSLDIGLKTGLTNLELNSTVQLVRREASDVALAPAVQYAFSTNGDDEGWGTYLFKVPVLIDFRFGRGGEHALVFGPTIAQAVGSGNSKNSGYDVDALFAGGTIGVSFKLGPTIRVMPEIAIYTPLAGHGVALQGYALRVSPDVGLGKPVIVQAGLALSSGK